MKVYARLMDEDENKYDFFIGPAGECPPLPREGEILDVGVFKGRVMEVEHDYSHGSDSVFIIVRVSSL